MSKGLLDKTRELMATRDLTLRELAQASGVGYEWLCKFSQGRIPDPSVIRVQAVHDFLVARSSPAAAPASAASTVSAAQ